MHLLLLRQHNVNLPVINILLNLVKLFKDILYIKLVTSLFLPKFIFVDEDWTEDLVVKNVEVVKRASFLFFYLINGLARGSLHVWMNENFVIAVNAGRVVWSLFLR